MQVLGKPKEKPDSQVSVEINVSNVKKTAKKSYEKPVEVKTGRALAWLDETKS